MRKMISILMILLLVSSVPAVADELFVPMLSIYLRLVMTIG